jgi:beta-xylosidase
MTPAIGLATNPTLDPDDPAYHWTDQGFVVKSTYNIRVGRSKTVTGPYLNKAGMDMLHSGGSLFLATTNGPSIGPGHAGTLNAQGKNWFTSEFGGDVRLDSRAPLAIMPLRWNADGWPVATTVNDVKTVRSADSATK